MMGGMDNLAAFLRARLDEEFTEAQRAGQATGETWFVPPDHPREVLDSGGGQFTAGSPSRAQHIARHDPARVLAEITAKHQLLSVWRDPDSIPAHDRDEYFEALGVDHAVRLLASVYDSHLGYREEWRP